MKKIVSLTSYKVRINTLLPTTLKSIVNQNDFEYDKIIVYLTENDFDRIDYVRFKSISNLDFKVVPDYKSYKKYLALTDKEFNKDLIWVIDDDLLFNRNTWNIFQSQYDDKKCIYTGTLCDWNGEKMSVIKDGSDAENIYFFGGCNFFPPNVGRLNVSDLEDGLNLLPTYDDIYLSVYYQTKGVNFKNINDSDKRHSNYQILRIGGDTQSLTNMNRNAFIEKYQMALDYFKIKK